MKLNLLLEQFIDDLRRIFFANYFKIRVKKNLKVLKKILKKISTFSHNQLNYHEIIYNFAKELNKLKSTLNNDLSAFIKGDPAAFDIKEIILTYPGFYAIMVYRIAHYFSQINVPYLPRMLSELAHQKTGIDIHPEAIIGNNFFIDHGTGVVIGQTSIIGNNVTIYQGVTLGALSLTKGSMLKGCKRHPTIKDYVTIYANAMILGGNTIIDNNVIIGANAIVTSSIEKNSIVKAENKISKKKSLKFDD